jgi:UDP-N-acetylmuramate--alanine ligase
MEHIHFIGIGGSGLSAIARLLVESGVSISGSDQVLSSFGKELMELGVTVYTGHAANQIEGASLVVRSSAIPDTNPEVVAARAAGIPVLKRADFLGRLMEERRGIAVAGTHGKTTTTSMLAWVLTSLGEDPSYIIGGVSKNLKNNAHAGRGSIFLIEADEYDRMFLGLQPEVGIVTTLEHDHPDCYPSMADYRQAFAAFVKRIKPGGCLLARGDDLETRRLTKAVEAGVEAFTFGLSETDHYQARNVQHVPEHGPKFQVWYNTAGQSQNLAEVALEVPGQHNVYNTLAVLGAIHQSGLDVQRAAEYLGQFIGTGRRFELVGEQNGILLIDDYAHHPTEIQATLAAARARFPQKRIWAIWQPHTYSRTQALRENFAKAFGDADQVIVTEIYASREKRQDFSAFEVVKQMAHSQVHFIPELIPVSEYLIQNLVKGDVVLVFSAGDADQINQLVLAGLKEKVW